MATRYGVDMQGATGIALTKLDVLSYMDRIPVCVRYRVHGEETGEFPFPMDLDEAEPVVEYWDGWHCDISAARSWEDLPKAAREYVEKIEETVSCPVTYISVGPERESLIVRTGGKKD